MLWVINYDLQTQILWKTTSPGGGSKKASCSSSMGSVSLWAVRLCIASVEICLYVLPQWLQLYGLEWVWTTWCLYKLEYSVNLLSHPGTVQTYGFSPKKRTAHKNVIFYIGKHNYSIMGWRTSKNKQLPNLGWGRSSVIKCLPNTATYTHKACQIPSYPAMRQATHKGKTP